MAVSSIKGNIALEIDEHELLASFSFTPSSDGAEWTAEKLAHLVMDNRLSGVSQKACEDFISKFARTKTPLTIVIVKGQAPEDPLPEEVEWLDLPIPPEILPLREEVAGMAGPPEIFCIKTDKIKHEEHVKKPGAMPFLPSKDEVVVTWEKVETKERVLVDTSINKIAYAHAGKRLGLLIPSKPGKGGKNIFGKPINPASGIDNTFYLGEGLYRNKNEIMSQVSGFIRISDRWADLIPFSATTFIVEKAQDQASFLLSLNPGDSRLPKPSASEIIAKAKGLGADETKLLSETELNAVILESIKNKEELFSYMLSKSEDSCIDLKIATDASRATLTIKKSKGHGKPVDLKKLSEVLKTCTWPGVDFPKIKQDILAFIKSTEQELVDYLIKEGTPPGRGKPRELTALAMFLSKEQSDALKARVFEKKASIRELSDFPIDAEIRLALVKKDQELYQLSKPENGKDGIDIYGKVIPALLGNDPVFHVGAQIHYTQGKMTALATGILLEAVKNNEKTLLVIPYRDCEIDVQISSDNLSAYVSLKKEVGPAKPLTLEGVNEALKAKGVVFGIDARKLGDAVKQALLGNPVLKFQVAWGKNALPAGEAHVELVGMQSVSSLTEASVKFTRSVAKDEVVARISQLSSSGLDGTDVLGKVIPKTVASAAPSADGKTVNTQPTHDANILERPSPDGSLELIAKNAGVLIVKGRHFAINEQYRIPSDIGPSTGNIKFPGSVLVEGAIKSGFMVIAGGDLLVKGQVEAAMLSSEGRIVVASGVRGANKAALHAKKTIEGSFAEQATLLAVEDVRLLGPCASCFVKTNGKVTLKGEKGQLAGGLVRAKLGIDVQDLGTSRSLKTEISFGQDYLIQDQIETEEREIDRIKQAILANDAKIRSLEKAGGNLDAARQEKVKLIKLLEKRSLRALNLRDKYEEHHTSEVRVRGTLYPGVILESHNRFYEVKQKRTGVVFSFDQKNGRIVERNL